MTLRLTAGNFPAEIVGVFNTPAFNLTETKYSAHDCLPRHSHERAYFVLVIKGNFREEYEQRHRMCRPSTLIFRPAQEVHRDYFNDEEARCLNIELQDQWLRDISNATKAFDDSADFTGEFFSHLSSRLYNEYRLMDAASSLAIEGLLLEIAAQASRSFLRPSVKAGQTWIRRAEELMRSEFREPLTLSMISKALDVHPVHLATTFQKVYGFSVGEFIRRLRVEYACSELANSDRPIIKIALTAGFYDQSHFSRTFKRVMGMTPAQYRANFDKH